MQPITQAILSVTTRWMQDTVAGRLWGTYAALWEAENDACVQALTLDDGTNPTALEPMGRSREIVRARFESDYDYATRLFRWTTAHLERGSPERIARAVWTYLDGAHGGFGVTYIERLPGNEGRFTHVDGDGTASESIGPWNWDGISHPERQGYWSDFWILIHAPAGTSMYTYPPYAPDASDWPSSPDVTWGQDIPLVHRDNIMQLIEWARPCHTNVVSVIWCPAGLTPSPDGTWGEFGYMDPLTGITMPARDPDFRYWEP
ncbi:MAG: hypothetical protein KF764_02940 [Labilithrix sp.]|nr:hypothetical protein [Labilithrix sp.]